jgi:hypothetical protein
MGSEKIYKVFVSSTYEDLREERAAVQKGLLLLGCLPVGMELFPAADEETWSFIKSQIDDSDYYVVVVAGRYGSEATDGISFTEKEYDYAISQKKPTIGFVHAEPGAIAASKTEKKARAKLKRFIAKIRTRPVRQFRSPHELALEVTTSFVQLIRDRPAVGYVRTDQAVDFKRYSELLEENNKLKEVVNVAQHSLATYVFGGCGPTGLLRKNATGQQVCSQDKDVGDLVLGPNGRPQICFRPDCRNFGQTPAWVKHMVLVYCPELPSKPNYASGKVREISDSVGPGWQKHVPGAPEIVEMETATKMLYGRIYYLDMLENERYSSFVYRLRDDGDHERVADEKYAEFRKWG